MIPLSVIHFFVHQQALGLFCLLLRFPMAKEEKSIGLSGAEVKGNRTGFLSVPFRKCDERFWCLKSDGI
uniref:Uncharacterized protein n=1 Tax=Sinocyclocheilus anshuiensis TaxID=1608454 RepID=A0A671T550_9TELE